MTITVAVDIREGLVHVTVRDGEDVIYEEAHPTEQAIAERCAVIADRSRLEDADNDPGAAIRAEFGIE